MIGATGEIDQLLTESSQDDWALITPSLYETARLVSIAPWLSGHSERLAYLCSEQGADGGWGVTGFRVVPTLSATEALLTTCDQRCSARSAARRRAVDGADCRRDVGRFVDSPHLCVAGTAQGSCPHSRRGDRTGVQDRLLLASHLRLRVPAETERRGHALTIAGHTAIAQLSPSQTRLRCRRRSW